MDCSDNETGKYFVNFDKVVATCLIRPREYSRILPKQTNFFRLIFLFFLACSSRVNYYSCIANKNFFYSTHRYYFQVIIVICRMYFFYADVCAQHLRNKSLKIICFIYRREGKIKWRE